MINSEAFFEKKLTEIEEASAMRELRSPFGIDYCSNDYLGLAENKKLNNQINQALTESKLGSGGSRLIRGHYPEIEMLESKLAQFSGKESALFFATGYQANVALMACLLREKAVVFSDELNHASIIDGIKLSGCEKYIWGHNDVRDLEILLKQKAKEGHLNVVVVESLYSMRGDQAPLQEILDVCEKYGAELIVDEAHATGLYGERGSGLVESHGLTDQVLATLHTAGKSLGVSGAWIAGSDKLIQYLVNRSRAFIYSTAPAHYQVKALEVALNFFTENKSELIQRFMSGLENFQTSIIEICGDQYPVNGLGGPVTSVVIGENQKTVEAMESLRENGFDVRAIRPPTVPKGESLLRITHCLPRTNDQDQKLLACLKEVLLG